MIASVDGLLLRLRRLLAGVCLVSLATSCGFRVQYIAGNSGNVVDAKTLHVGMRSSRPDTICLASAPVRSLAPLKDEVRWIVFPRKEVRALWIATVSNLDWPSPASTPEQQQSDLIKIYDLCRDLNINTVVLQVRPLSDALYQSEYEPWSHVLTGTQGQDPGYDPLRFAVDEAHKRGLSLHAWINPYRIGANALPMSANNIARKHSKWVVEYDGVKYLNPGLPAVREHLNNVVKDIITHYEVDAIHFDDYFYPGGIKHDGSFDFNDRTAYRRYGKGKNLNDWRTDNVNTLIEEVHNTIKRYRPEVLFGISPSGRHENSLKLFADPLVWMSNHWIDYLTPQLYWEFGHEVGDFGTLAKYWDSNTYGTPLTIGIGTYRFSNPKSPLYGKMDELARQLDAVRTMPNLYGVFFFRTKDFSNGDIYATVKDKFAEPALLPLMGSVEVAALTAPKVELKKHTLYWNPVDGASRYVVYRLVRDANRAGQYKAHIVEIQNETTFSGNAGELYVVTALTPHNQESQSSNVVPVL